VPAPVDPQADALLSVGKAARALTAQLLAPLRPPDPTLFVRAGTSGVRHLFPIHLTDNENEVASPFCRPISHARSRTPTTEMCSNVDMIRNICSSMKTLQHFDVSRNELQELPLDISLLVELETLNGSHNQLSEMADLFEQLKHLKELDISFNQFKRLPDVIYTLKSLVRLNCEHNSITQFESCFINLKRLKVFVADHNQLDSVDTIDFAQMKKLEYIHLAHNQLLKFPRGLHLLHHLKNVNLSNNRLKSFPIDLLLLNTLDVLNLGHNLITKLPPMPIAYKRGSMIFSIDLSFNQLNKFYEFLLLIALKVDVSNNRIRVLSSDFMKKLTNDLIVSRELKIHNNPLTQPLVPPDMLHETNSTKINVLRMIRNCFDEQQLDVHIRQGFKICITGCKGSGKTALATCLEESMPLNLDETEEEKQERLVHGKKSSSLANRTRPIPSFLLIEHRVCFSRR
jgi:Leucine-rich repeat (LRR) protein